MIVTSEGIVDGKILSKYGARGDAKNSHGVPTYSLPVKIRDYPEATKSFAIVLDDKDSYPLTPGFAWTHWLAANILRDEIMENESQSATDFVQGANSWISPQGGNQSIELSSFYGGMNPHGGPHIYTLKVYALSETLQLSNGFMLNELFHEMNDFILDEAKILGSYEPVES